MTLRNLFDFCFTFSPSLVIIKNVKNLSGFQRAFITITTSYHNVGMALDNNFLTSMTQSCILQSWSWGHSPSFNVDKVGSCLKLTRITTSHQNIFSNPGDHTAT